MDNVVVTGATSMLGSALIRALLRHDTKMVYAVVQPDSKNLDRLPDDRRIQPVRCLCEDYSELAGLINNRCDVFYHFAWIPSKKEKSLRYFDVDSAYQNIGQSLLALKAAAALGCKTFIGAGSQAEYGISKEKIQSPESLTNPITTYGIAKDTIRRLCMVKAEELGIRVQWIRIFSVYGPHDRKNTLISTLLPKLLNNESVALSDCNQLWDYLYEDDAGEGLYYAGMSKGSNIYCLGSGIAKPLREYVEDIRRITKSESMLDFGALKNTSGTATDLHANIQSLLDNTEWPGPQIQFDEGIGKILSVLLP